MSRQQGATYPQPAGRPDHLGRGCGRLATNAAADPIIQHPGPNARRRRAPLPPPCRRQSAPRMSRAANTRPRSAHCALVLPDGQDRRRHRDLTSTTPCAVAASATSDRGGVWSAGLRAYVGSGLATSDGVSQAGAGVHPTPESTIGDKRSPRPVQERTARAVRQGGRPEAGSIANRLDDQTHPSLQVVCRAPLPCRSTTRALRPARPRLPRRRSRPWRLQPAPAARAGSSRVVTDHRIGAAKDVPPRTTRAKLGVSSLPAGSSGATTP